MAASAYALASWASPVTSVLWLPGVLALVATVAGMIADMTGHARRGLVIVALGLAGATMLTIGLAISGVAQPETAFAVLAGVLVGGGSFAGVASVVYGTAFLALSTGMHGVPEDRRVGTAALIALSAVACQVLIGAGDVLVLFLALEIVALAGYAMVASAGNRRSDEAAMRYFVQGAVASGLLVYGIAVLVGLHGGVTSSSGLYEAVASDPIGVGVLPFVLVLAALAFKAGAFPFHSWVPDAYETAPAGVTSFLASGPKAAVLTAMLVVFGRSFWAQDAFTDAHALIGILAAGSIVFGNFGALGQRDLGRMLGYSGIAQVGYALVGVAAGVSTVPLFASAYALAVAVAFACAETLRRLRPEWDGSVEGLAGAARTSPALALALTVSMLSLTGIPLTAGFVGKFFVFYAAAQSGLTWLVVIGALGSVVSFAYYGRVIKVMYLDDTAGETSGAGETEDAARVRVWPIALVTAVILAIGIMPLALDFQGLLRFFGV